MAGLSAAGAGVRRRQARREGFAAVGGNRGEKTNARRPLYLWWVSRASTRALPMNSPYRLTGQPDLRTSRS
jgi:hypothetical protein